MGLGLRELRELRGSFLLRLRAQGFEFRVFFLCQAFRFFHSKRTLKKDLAFES